MIKAEPRGEYDFDRTKSALVVSDEHDQRLAIFLSERRGARDIISVAVSLPKGAGTLTYGVEFGWLLDHLRKLKPTREAAES